MNKKTLLIILAIQIVIAAVLAVVVSSSQPKKKASEVIITAEGTRVTLDLKTLELKDVKATITSANGKTKDIDAKGIELKDLLKGYVKIDDVKVTSEDSYTAVLSDEDIEKDANVYVILGDNGKPRLIVLSDTDAKRDVKDVLTIEVLR